MGFTACKMLKVCETFVKMIILASPVLAGTNEHFYHPGPGYGHDLHKDHIAFLGEEAARELEGLTRKESIRRLR